MNYQKHYSLLIEKTDKRNQELFGINFDDSGYITKKKSKKAGVYGENHHIIPKCIDESLIKEPTNLVFLLPEEHYVAHQLLAKMYPKHYGLIETACKMTVSSKYHNRINNKLYSWLRKRILDLKWDYFMLKIK